MNKMYVSNVVPRYSKIVLGDRSIKPNSSKSITRATSYSGLGVIVEDKPPTAAAVRVNDFFAACKNIKVADTEREDKLSELKREEQIAQEKLIVRKVRKYQFKLRAKLAKRVSSRELADHMKQQDELEGLMRAEAKLSDKIVKSKGKDKVKHLANIWKPVLDQKLKNKRVKKNFRTVNKMKPSDIPAVISEKTWSWIVLR